MHQQTTPTHGDTPPHKDTPPPAQSEARTVRICFTSQTNATFFLLFYFILFVCFLCLEIEKRKKNDTTAPLSSSCCRSSSSSLMATPLFVHNPALVPSYSSSSPVRVRVFHCISVGACVCV